MRLTDEALQKAFRTAYCIHPNRDVAWCVTMDGYDKGQLLLKLQQRRPDSKRPFKWVPEEDFPQAGIYLASEEWEKDQESSTPQRVPMYRPNYDDLLVRYLKRLIWKTMDRAPGYAAIAIGCGLYTYHPYQIRDISEDFIDSDNIRRIKGWIVNIIEERFQDAGIISDKHGEIVRTTRPTNDQRTLVYHALAALAPWFPCESIPKASSFSLFETHFAQGVLKSNWERVHVLIDPVCGGFKRIVDEYNDIFGKVNKMRLDDPDQMLGVPDFGNGPNAPDNGGGGSNPSGPGSRFNPSPLTSTEINSIKHYYERNQDRRNSYRLGSIRLLLDGQVIAVIAADNPSSESLTIPSTASYLELIGEDDRGELLLAVFPLIPAEMSDDREEEQELYVTYGSDLTFRIFISNVRDQRGLITARAIRIVCSHTSFTTAEVALAHTAVWLDEHAGSLRVNRITSISGPNIYTHRPVLLMDLCLGTLTEIESIDISGFVDRLLRLLPGLYEHRCSRGYEGGFVERLHEGTYFAHIVEHVAIELSGLAGFPVSFGRSRYAGERGRYSVIVEYKAEQAMRFLLNVAVELVEALVVGDPFPLGEKLQEARTLAGRTELGPSTRAIVDAAERRGIPWFRIGDRSFVQLGYGKNRRHIQAAVSSRTSAVSVEVAGDKELTKILLEQASIPVPRSITVDTWPDAVDAFARIGGAVVVKPLDGRQGKGVSLNLTTPEEVAHAFHIAQAFSTQVLVEELFVGRNYRVLVVGNRMVAASERHPAHVFGDGRHTIGELIEIANRDPLRGEGHEKPLTRIEINSILLAHLEKTGLSLTHIPHAGEMVVLREGISLSTGGTARDVTDIVHESVRRMCERAARIIGMDVCGIDLVLRDIAEPLSEDSGGIIELNASPGLRMHLYPSEGRTCDVGSAICNLLYPEGTPSRIPLISITGTNGKTTVTRMVSHIISATGAVVGMTTSDGIYIGGELVVEGDTTGPRSARAVLSDPTVEVAVLETALGGIMRRGLGYDWSDIAVITNIQPDHLGQDGIESVEDLIYIKSLVAERVRKGGTLILNADDEHLARLMETERVSRVPKRVVYFSLYDNHLLIKRHVFAGGTAYFVRAGWVVEATADIEREIVQVALIPAAIGGTAEFNVANALASVASARAYGLSVEQVAEGLISFCSEEHNSGRTNLYRVGTGYVLLDYGHNSGALQSICRMASQWQGYNMTAVLGVPGDRCDALIEEAGRIVARGFSRVVIKEDKDLRWRAPGEVAQLLLRAIKDAAPERECQVVLDECEAIEQEIQRVSEGDIVVIFYDKLKPVKDVLTKYGAIPVRTIADMYQQVRAFNNERA